MKLGLFILFLRRSVRFLFSLFFRHFCKKLSLLQLRVTIRISHFVPRLAYVIQSGLLVSFSQLRLEMLDACSLLTAHFVSIQSKSQLENSLNCPFGPMAEQTC